MTNKVKVITHYDKKDTTFSGDYCSIDIEINGIPVVSFGDHYHDHGREKCQGFIEACLYFIPDIEIERINVADCDML